MTARTFEYRLYSVALMTAFAKMKTFRTSSISKTLLIQELKTVPPETGPSTDRPVQCESWVVLDSDSTDTESERFFYKVVLHQSLVESSVAIVFSYKASVKPYVVEVTPTKKDWIRACSSVLVRPRRRKNQKNLHKTFSRSNEFSDILAKTFLHCAQFGGKRD